MIMDKIGEEWQVAYQKINLHTRLHQEATVIINFMLLLMMSTSFLGTAVFSIHHNSFPCC